MSKFVCINGELRREIAEQKEQLDNFKKQIAKIKSVAIGEYPNEITLVFSTPIAVQDFYNFLKANK